jgi:Fur family ferric uptake transcriptional regulator
MEDTDLKKAGLKVTVPRLKILQILESQPQESQHMSAEEVYDRLREQGEKVGLATVYRVLTQFEAAGLVTRHAFETGQSSASHAVFELDRGEHHDHMVCVESGRVIEFCDPEIERRQRAIAEQHGFEIMGHSLVLYVKPKRSS